MTKLKTYLYSIGACGPALDWVGDRTAKHAWEECPRGDWLLWVLEDHGVDCSEAGYWCAERARQSALRALPPGPTQGRLAAYGPIVDRETAVAAADAAAWAASRAASREAWAAADAAARAAWEAGESARAELRTIADYVRAHYQRPKIRRAAA